MIDNVVTFCRGNGIIEFIDSKGLLSVMLSFV